MLPGKPLCGPSGSSPPQSFLCCAMIHFGSLMEMGQMLSSKIGMGQHQHVRMGKSHNGNGPGKRAAAHSENGGHGGRTGAHAPITQMHVCWGGTHRSHTVCQQWHRIGGMS